MVKLHISPTWSNIYISLGLTPKEHQQNQLLRDELKIRRNAGEKDLYIKHGKIVSRQADAGSSVQPSNCQPGSHISVSRSLKVFYANRNQLLNKFDELLTLVHSDNPDIILIVEVIPKAQQSPIATPNLSIPGFTDFDPNLTNLGSCGKRGICIYIAEDLQLSEIQFDNNFEVHMWVKIKLLSNEWLVIGNYTAAPLLT